MGLTSSSMHDDTGTADSSNCAVSRGALECTHMRIGIMSKTYKRGRDASTGRFIPVAVAERRKATAIVETVKKKK